jgi:serine/threonine protein kinase
VNLSARDLTGSLGKATVDKATQLGRGATATVHPARLGGHAYAAKLFLEDQAFPTSKVLAMLANPPTRLKEQGSNPGAVRLAWPVAILSDDKGRDVGLLMPVVDLKASYPLDYFYDLTLFKKLKAPNEAALSFKLEIGRNLSSLVAELHEHGHYFIDMKPQNIRVTLGSHEITLLDCDGFSIAGQSGSRHAAELVSTDYISPEAFRGNTPPSALGEPQDRYALAVLLFQLLNRGTHPFQGIPADESVDVATNDEKAARGMYPHGRSPHPRLRPRPHSIHGLFDDGLRALFDQAFVGGAGSRPSAKDWAHKFNQLLTSKALVRCFKFPNDVAHLRFRDKQCPACYLAAIPAIKASPSAVAKVRPPIVEPPQTVAPPRSAVQPPGRGPSRFPAGMPPLAIWVIFLGIPLAAVLFLADRANTLSADQRDPPEQTADQGDAAAQNDLGSRYANGSGVAKNEAEAVKWYRLAAAQGHAAAQNNLASMYANGRGVVEDDVEAVKLYRMSADQGYADAQYNLGVMYANGSGVARNEGEAMSWFRLAADQGYAVAQASLGFMYATGEGVSQDYVQAYKWAALAADQGHGNAKTLKESLETLMTRDDRIDAQRLYSSSKLRSSR